MSEANKPTEYVMTCIDGTTFRLPVDVPVWSDEKQALTIGGIEVDAIYRDPSLLPPELWDYEVEKVREVSEVKEVDEVPIRDIFSEIDELKADVEWLKKEVRRVDWKDAYD